MTALLRNSHIFCRSEKWMKLHEINAANYFFCHNNQDRTICEHYSAYNLWKVYLVYIKISWNKNSITCDKCKDMAWKWYAYSTQLHGLYGSVPLHTILWFHPGLCAGVKLYETMSPAQLTKMTNFYIAFHVDWSNPLCNGLWLIQYSQQNLISNI